MVFKKLPYDTLDFRRPGWEEVIELIESGQVATLIVKDMSRLGREYLQREINTLQKRIDADSRREAELTTLFTRLYEDSALERIPDEQYRVLSNEYLAEQKQIQEELPKLQARQQELKESVANVARFIDMAKKYGQIDELTPEILWTFVRRIEVGERGKRYSRTAPREIKIYYREIGLVDDPPQCMEAEDAVAQPPQSQEIA